MDDAATLLRHAHRLREHWLLHLGEKAALGNSAVAFNSQLPAGNLVTHVSAQNDDEFEVAKQEVDHFFTEQGTKCQQWLINPAQREDERLRIISGLSRLGWQQDLQTVWKLQSQEHQLPTTDLQVIPARAGYALLEQLMVGIGQTTEEPQMAEAMLLHLDDPRVDSLLGIQQGRAIATISVLGDGQNALICALGFEAGSASYQSVGKSMVHRAIDVCRRSLFKNVFTFTPQEGASHFWRELGFEPIGELASMLRSHRS